MDEFPAEAVAAIARAVAGYEPEATAAITASPKYLLSVLLEAARRGAGVAKPYLVAAERGRVDRLRAQVREMQVVLERKNRELDALHMVWCDGGCPSGVHRWSDLIVTEELVATAERNTRRLRRWYETVKFRLGLKSPTADKWLERYAARAAAKTDLLDGDM